MRTEQKEKTSRESGCCTRRVQCFCLFIVLTIVVGVLTVIGILHHVTKNRYSTVFNESALNRLDRWEAPKEIQEHFTYYLAGYDYQNTAVWVVPFGKYKTQDYLNRVGEEGEAILEKYTDQFYYRLQKSRMRPRVNRTDGSIISSNNSFIIVCDLTDYSVSNLAMPFLLRMANKFADPVSEIDYGYVVNLDWWSKILVNVAQSILGVALSKMEMFSEDEHDVFLKSIAEKIPTSQLPVEFGGSENYQPLESFG